MKILFVFLIANVCWIADAQVIQNPLKDAAKFHPTYGETGVYYEWIVDINHDGLKDILLSAQATPEMVKADEDAARFIPESYQPDQHAFAVYLGLKTGGYINAGGMLVDVSQCYLGYIKELKQYGIVSVENSVVDDPDEPQARHGVLKQQIFAYTIHQNKVIETKLTSLFDPDEKNAVYDEYLSDSKLTKIQLREVAP
jgi:hypothetical protein